MEGEMFTRINQDIKEAMKAKEKEKLQALRYLKSMLMENATSKKPQEEMDVIIRHHKKLKDGLTTFPPEHPMHEQTKKEIIVVENYLPQALSEDEVIAIILDIKNNLDHPNMGGIMKELGGKIKGRFDGKRASELVKENLN